MSLRERQEIQALSWRRCLNRGQLPFGDMLKIGAAMLAVLSVACGGGATDESTTSTLASTTTSTTIATTTTQAPTTTSTIVTTTTSTVASTTTTLPEFPQTLTTLTHGGDAWAVYLAVADNYEFTAPELGEAQDLAEMYGIEIGTGELACDHGGAEALGLDPDEEWAAVSALFESEADAQQFVDAFEARGHSVVGLGLVQTFCLD
jgi:hypothetical protein